MTNGLNSYQLSRFFWDFAFENPSKIKPIHCAIYFFSIEHCNRLGWKKEFGLPTSMVIEAIGVKSYSVYKKAFDDLVKYNFFDVIQYSKNQYSSNIIALKENYKANYKANDKALDKALIKHITKQTESTVQSTCQSTVSIDKQETIEQETIKHTNTIFSFDEFWETYNKKTGRANCERIYARLKDKDYAKIKETLPIYLDSVKDKQFLKNPQTYLNGRIWEDEIYQPPTQKKQEPQEPIYSGYIDLSKLKPLR